MIRPMPAGSGLRGFFLATTLGVLVAAGCSGPPAVASPSSADATCAVETAPGPDDQVPGPGEMDVSDIGSGRLRLCLDAPAQIDIEGSAWCTWDEARTSVREVAGLPVTLPSGAT